MKDKKKIMVVDDEEDFLKAIKITLEQVGKYEVMILATAKDIIEQVNKFKPDVILLDLLMPGIGGIDVCEMLNNDPIGATIPVIVLSALGKIADKAEAYRVGVVDYLVKPLDREILFNKIGKALEFKGS